MFFTELMEVNASATAHPARPLPLDDVGHREVASLQYHQFKLPIQRLNLENTQLVGDVLQSFGRVLGPKQAAFVVDDILADMLEAWTRGDKADTTNLSVWSGGLAVATKVRLYCSM